MDKSLAATPVCAPGAPEQAVSQQGPAVSEPLQALQQAQRTGGSAPGLPSHPAQGLLGESTSLERELLAGSGLSEQHLQAGERSQAAQDHATAALPHSGPGLASLEPECRDPGVAAADLALQDSAEMSAGQVRLTADVTQR